VLVLQKPDSENKMSLERKVTKAIVAASYDDSGPHADQKVIETAEVERRSGNRFINHLILRNKTNNRLKFNFLLPPGVPAIVYSLTNVLHSDLDEVVVVGNSDTQKIVEQFVEVYGVSSDRIKFNHEGDEWSLSNTLRKGVDVLGSGSGLVLYLPGDVPLGFNINAKINDEDVKETVGPNGEGYDAILDLNSKSKVGKRFPRNYHLKVIYGGRSYWVKEPNMFLLDLDRIPLDLIDTIYGGRKTYVPGGGRAKVIGDLLVNNGRWRKSLEAMGLDAVPLTMKAIPVLKKYFDHGTGITRWASKILLGPIAGAVNLFSDGIVSIRTKTLERIAEMGPKIRARIKVYNDDPGTLEDLDSLEDWADLTQMLTTAQTRIHPHYNKLKIFQKEAMPSLGKSVEMYENWQMYMNKLFETYGLNPPYVDGKFQMPFDDPAVRRMIRLNIRFHERYVRAYKKGRKN